LRVAGVAVGVGQAVDDGQVLVEADTAAAQVDLAAARTRQEQANGSVQAARSSIETRLRRAMADLELLTAPPAESERLTAVSAVASARAALLKARADLEKLTAPPSPPDVQAAEQEITAAALAVRKAEADLMKLRQGPDPAAVRKAQSDLVTAEGAYAKAQDAYRILVKGPDPYEARAAERAVEEARSSLRIARESKPVPATGANSSGSNSGATRAARQQAEAQNRTAQLQYEANVRRAEFALENAEDRLAKLNQGPSRADIDAAIRTVDNARRQLEDARDRQAELQQGPSQLDIDTAEADVSSARADLARAQTRRDNLARASGPSPAELAAAQAGVQTAQAGAAIAEARLNELSSGRRDGPEIRSAQNRVEALQRLLDAPVDNLEAVTADIGRDDKELLDAVQAYRDAVRGLVDEQRRVASQEAAVASARLVAPFPGVVTAVLANVGDVTQPGRPTISVARGTEPLVRAAIGPASATRVVVGQQATVELADRPGVRTPATVSDLTGDENSREAILSASWEGAPPPFGTAAQVAITIRRQDDALIVPQRAIRAVGSRRFVDILEGTAIRRIEVEAGITSGADAEVTAPLREGQLVIIGP
jgi:multidrug resistance efflux pump